MKVLSAELVATAARTADLPHDDVPRIAMVGRSNVGKSSLINALVRRRVARTSAAPGKTRLANLYRVTLAGRRTLDLVDLPGYGYARGGDAAREEFRRLTTEFFGAAVVGRQSPVDSHRRQSGDAADVEGAPGVSALLVVDARHPGLDSDLAAVDWIERTGIPYGVVATKIDKLTRGERARVVQDLKHSFGEHVLPVSVKNGEGMDDLWKLITRLASSPQRTAATPRS